eukprot:Platyproteum_vivax@DN1224_c0_g1_i2.p1
MSPNLSDYSKQSSALTFTRSQSAPVEASKPDFLKSLSGADLSKTAVGKALEKHKNTMLPWTLLVFGLLVVYHMYSDGDYSVMLTVGSVIQSFSFLLILVKILVTKSTSGVSRGMFLCIFCLSLARLSSVLPFDGYLPFDRSGDLVYRLAEILSTAFSGTIVYLCSSKKYQCTSTLQADSFQILWLIAPCAILALFMHANLNRCLLTDIAWAFALYLECLCVLPQLVLFQKDKKADSSTANFLMAQAIGRLLNFAFWFWTFHELNEATGMRAYTGYW